MIVEEILKKDDDRLMKSWTGVTIDEFKKSVKDIEKTIEEEKQRQYEEGLKNGTRKRKPNGGRKGKLKTVSEQLFLVLVYLKNYPIFDVLASIFNMNRSNACRNIHKLIPLLEIALENAAVMPLRKIRNMGELFETFPEISDFFIDGTERPVQRSKNNDEQKEDYSGKKKKHTKKNTIIAKENKEILCLGITVGGSIHDYKLFKEESPPNKGLPEPTPAILSTLNDPRIWVDLGYFGMENDYPELNVMIPIKKPKGGELSADEKVINRLISSVRVRVENAICGIKRFRIVTDTFRNKTKGLCDRVMGLSCGLWNYHVVYG